MSHIPLAEQLRPQTIDDIVGHEHLLAPGQPLRVMLEAGRLHSLVLWGPPGAGKTTLARLLARCSRSTFVEFSAVTSGVAEIRKVISQAKEQLDATDQTTILFIDEIHRFHKGQQDAFLPHVEAGTITLIGATTENPGFEVIGPLISRSHVYRLEALGDQDLVTILTRAHTFFPHLRIKKSNLTLIAHLSGGDARAALNAFELIEEIAGPRQVTRVMIEAAFQRKAVMYDKKGDAHYDTISAFIKSMRGSEPNAALHYLARMLEGGEDPLFIARRMVIFASEDVGNALPTALVVATNAMQATHFVGLPEAQLILAQTATYLATAPKSRAVARAIGAAMHDVRTERLEPIPWHLRNPVNKVMKQFGAGNGYRWPKKVGDEPTELGYLPANLHGRRYWPPPEKRD